jgi:hypothetical protein
MASSRLRRRRLILPTLLAVVLAAEITGLAIARSGADAAPPARTPIAAAGAPTSSRVLPPVSSVDVPPDAARDTRIPSGTSRAPTPARLRQPAPALSTREGSTTGRPASPTSHGSSAAAPPRAPATAFHGRNHVWIPSLRVNRSVQSFPCSRSRPPDAGVYRWGCAGSNNVYLLAHAWSTFKPLHDAYVGHRLRKGMKVWYADGAGRVRAYAVAWWRVVAPTTAASWAWASQSRPSMTLQTCVGANSRYRLMVRLLQVR